MKNQNILVIENIKYAFSRIDIEMVMEELEFISKDSSRSIIMLTHKKNPHDRCIDDYLNRMTIVAQLMNFINTISTELYEQEINNLKSN